MVELLLPDLYHTHHQRQSEDLPFYLSLASQAGGPILELGCGTGRILEPLADVGYRVIGLDLDFDMLSYLRRRLKKAGKQGLPVFQADMGSFCLSQLFSLILLPCNTYSTFLPETRQNTLNQVKRHLSPGGIFAVSLPNPVILEELEEEVESEIEDEFILPTGEAVQVSSAWTGGEDWVTIDWQYDLLRTDGRVDRYKMQAVQYLNSPDIYQEEFIQNGLAIQSIYGDFDFSPFSEESPYLIFLLTQ